MLSLALDVTEEREDGKGQAHVYVLQPDVGLVGAHAQASAVAQRGEDHLRKENG